jgi:hypothetical protein
VRGFQIRGEPVNEMTCPQCGRVVSVAGNNTCNTRCPYCGYTGDCY